MREEQLDGGSRRIDLGGGYSLVTPGLKGRAVVHEGRAEGTRGPESATMTLDGALAAAGIHEVRTIELEVEAVPEPPDAEPVRSASGDDALELEVPDLGPEVGQVVLSVDEAGVVTWNFAEGDGTVRRFRVGRRIPPAPQEGSERGLIGTLGKKFLKVLVYPLTDPVLGAVGELFAAKWEAANRPHGLRWFTPDDYARAEGRVVGPDDWATLAAGPVLLFVHGTFSTAHGGFGGLPKDVMQELWRRYGGRVIAFNHPTLSLSPEENAAWFVSQIPAGVKLDLDIIGHSRGGLVSRMLAERFGGGPSMNVRRVVFVGTPNRGTQLADPAHMISMLDRFTTVLNFVPVASAQLVLESILVAVKVLGRSFLSGLPGLASMDPAGPFQSRVNGGTGSRAVYYGITSDFEPTEPGLVVFVRDQGMDRVFGEANDLVVPTEGVYGAKHPNFPIPPDRLLAYGHQDGVLHVTYFEKRATGEHLLKWLAPLPGSLGEVAATEGFPTARVTRTYNATPERVYDAWLDPELIGRWMFGPALREEEVLRISVDPRVGGAFSFLVRRQGQELDHVGTYLELDRPRRLAFTWGIAPDAGEGSTVVVEIVPAPGGCEVRLAHEMAPQWAEFVPQGEAAWAKMLGALAAVLG